MMEKLYELLKNEIRHFLEERYAGVSFTDFQFQPTNKDHTGNITLMVFPIAKLIKANPEQIASEIGSFLTSIAYVSQFTVVKGFLNLDLSVASWNLLLREVEQGVVKTKNIQKIVLEYCGPNTNKPLHVGHLRNMFLGYSVAEILKEVGHDVHKVNIYNDRGIAICKSMIAYHLYGQSTTPESEGMKSDFFVGHYYTKYNQVFLQEVHQLISEGTEKEKAEVQAPIFQKANDMLMRWEEGDESVLALWNKMNNWCYQGLHQTYQRLGIDTEKDYYESQEYLKGKEIVALGYQKGVFQKDDTGAIFVDLSEKGLDKKYLQRANGTSIYITQDMALVKQRFEDYAMDRMIYVVGDEQIYHFKVLKAIMETLNEPFSSDIFHLYYGMVLGKDGQKFKSREGTAADADIITSMVVQEAKEQTMSAGKSEGMSSEELDSLSEIIGIGALKYAMLKVNAKKSILFDPKEAVDLHGDTGVFIQYCNTRTKSILKKYTDDIRFSEGDHYEPEEQNLILQLAEYHATVHRAADLLDPSEIAQFALQLAKIYNRFYTQLSILKEDSPSKKAQRLYLTRLTNLFLEKSMKIMGITAPERM